jgi:hypothetical protein
LVGQLSSCLTSNLAKTWSHFALLRHS